MIRMAIKGISAYKAGKPIDEVKEELGIDKVIKLASNENCIGCSEYAKKAIADSIADTSIYPDGHCNALRKELAKFLKVNEDQFTFGTGSDEIIRMIAEVFIDPGDEAIMTDPSFQSYEIATKMMGGVIRKIPVTNEYKNDFNAILNAINDKTRVIWICNPNNPLGTIMSEEQQQELLKKIPDDVIVVLDEAYNEFADDKSFPDSVNSLSEHKNVIILRTFSKIYGLASLRVGYAIASAEIAGYLNRIKAAFNVTTMAQAAAIASLKDQQFRQKTKNVIDQGKEYLYKELGKNGYKYIRSEANFIMIDTKVDSAVLFNEMLKLGVIIRSGDIFGMNTWIRVTVGTAEENRIFIDVLNKAVKSIKDK